jgi:hypothetical protein
MLQLPQYSLLVHCSFCRATDLIAFIRPLLQVFPTQGYDELFNAVRNSTAAGGPSYHMATYDVLTNSFQAIFGGWQVGSNASTSQQAVL